MCEVVRNNNSGVGAYLTYHFFILIITTATNTYLEFGLDKDREFSHNCAKNTLYRTLVISLSVQS